MCEVVCIGVSDDVIGGLYVWDDCDVVFVVILVVDFWFVIDGCVLVFGLY